MRISDWSSDVCSSDLFRLSRTRRNARWTTRHSVDRVEQSVPAPSSLATRFRMKGGCVNPAFSSQKLSTASVPVRERLPMWREVFGQAMVRLDIEPTKDMPFHAEGTLCALPGAAYASVSASPVRVSRTRRLISADPVEML